MAIPLAGLLYLATVRLRDRQPAHLFRELASILAGAGFVWLLAIVFFAWNGALDDFWQAAFVYNFAYISLPWISRLKTLLSGMDVFSSSGLIQISLLGFGLAAFEWVFPDHQRPSMLPLLKIGLIALPLELISANLSGRPYPHYNIGFLPVLAVFSGYSFLPPLSRLWLARTLPRFAPACLFDHQCWPS